MSLDNVEFLGKSWQDVRTALNKAGKQEIELLPSQWAECGPAVTDQFRAISGERVSDKALPEMGFTLGTLRDADDPEVRLHLAVGSDKTVDGFTSWMPVSQDAYRFISLSAAPLAKLPVAMRGSGDEQVFQERLNLLGAVLEPYYGFRPLFRFKEKFNPEHRPHYLVFPDETALAEISPAVARAYVPDAGLGDWVRMGAEMVLPKRNGATSGDQP